MSATFSTAPRVLTALPLAIDPDEVLRFQGYKKSVDTPGPEVLAIFDEALALGRGLVAPRAVVRWLAVTRRDADTIEAGGVTLTIPDVGRLWGPIEWVAAAVCTIGDGLERRAAELWAARELPLAAMLDSVGSGAVESLAEYVNDLLCQEAIPLGLPVTNRVSPGYGLSTRGPTAPGSRGANRSLTPRCATRSSVVRGRKWACRSSSVDWEIVTMASARRTDGGTSSCVSMRL